MYVDGRDATEEEALELAQEAVGQLVGALGVVERDVLEGFAGEQVGRGNVTVVNQ